MSDLVIKQQKLNINGKTEEKKLKIKKPNVDLPVKYKSVDYYKVIDSIRSSLKSSDNELTRNNLKNCMEYLESCLFYYNNITTN